jgi:hypothetical protein
MKHNPRNTRGPLYSNYVMTFFANQNKFMTLESLAKFFDRIQQDKDDRNQNTHGKPKRIINSLTGLVRSPDGKIFQTTTLAKATTRDEHEDKNMFELVIELLKSNNILVT